MLSKFDPGNIHGKILFEYYLSNFDFFFQLLEVYQNDRFLGRVREVPVCCTRKHLEVWNKNEEKIYDISGPCCPFSCGGSVPFPVIVYCIFFRENSFLVF